MYTETHIVPSYMHATSRSGTVTGRWGRPRGDGWMNGWMDRDDRPPFAAFDGGASRRRRVRERSARRRIVLRAIRFTTYDDSR